MNTQKLEIKGKIKIQLQDIDTYIGGFRHSTENITAAPSTAEEQLTYTEEWLAYTEQYIGKCDGRPVQMQMDKLYGPNIKKADVIL